MCILVPLAPLRALHHSTYPSSYLTLQETPGIRGILPPQEKEGAEEGWAAGGETMRGGSTRFRFNKSPLDHFTHPDHGRGGAEGSEAAWSSGQEGEKKIHPTAATSIQYFCEIPACSEPRFFFLFSQSAKKKKRSSSKT